MTIKILADTGRISYAIQRHKEIVEWDVGNINFLCLHKVLRTFPKAL